MAFGVDKKGDWLLLKWQVLLDSAIIVIALKIIHLLIDLWERLPSLDYQSVDYSWCKYEPK